MADTGVSHLPHKEIIIADAGDSIIKIIEHKVTRQFSLDTANRQVSSKTKSVPIKVASIRVSRGTLMECSDYFRAMFQAGTWGESKKDTITLAEDTVKSMEVWLRLFHDKLSELPVADIPIEEIWHVLMAGNKYGFHSRESRHGETERETHLRTELRAWFWQWCLARLQKLFGDETFRRQLLFPAYQFGFVSFFQCLTKTVVYESAGQVAEVNPTSLHQMHLPARVIQQLNAARGRLRTILHRQLFEDVSRIVGHAKCSCKEQTVFSYFRALQQIGAWPLEEALAKTSVADLLDQLREFHMPEGAESAASNDNNSASSSPMPPQKPPCRSCNRDWKGVVESAAEYVQKYFDGLCLDCMDSSKNVRPGGDEDDDYWVYSQTRGAYDGGCRVSHGEPTWYFSFMGGREKRGGFQN